MPIPFGKYYAEGLTLYETGFLICKVGYFFVGTVYLRFLKLIDFGLFLEF